MKAVKQNNIISPTGCVHIEDSVEKGRTLCNHNNYHLSYGAGFYHDWPHTDKPVTCIRCLNRLDKDTPVKLCLRRIKTLERAYDAEMARFNENIRTKCEYYKESLVHGVRFIECIYYKDNHRQCCIAHCPLG